MTYEQTDLFKSNEQERHRLSWNESIRLVLRCITNGPNLNGECQGTSSEDFRMGRKPIIQLDPHARPFEVYPTLMIYSVDIAPVWFRSEAAKHVGIAGRSIESR